MLVSLGQEFVFVAAPVTVDSNAPVQPWRRLFNPGRPYLVTSILCTFYLMLYATEASKPCYIRRLPSRLWHKTVSFTEDSLLRCFIF